jgi:Protein of unknown function (DUF3667)
MLDETPPNCLNCGHRLGEPRPRFCPECGQETNVRPPRIGEFLQQFGGAYFATEGALWRTFKLLLFKPGELTRQYLAGRRKHYVLPLRLYLSVSVVVLLVMRVLASAGMDSGFQFDINPRKSEYTIVSIGDGMEAGMKDGQFFCRGFPTWVCKRLQRRLDLDPKGLQMQAAELGQRAIGNIGLGMFFILPLFAAGLKLVYINRGLRYTEHLVFALHLHAFWFVALMFTLGDLPWLNGAAGLAIPVYTWLAMRRVYRDRWWTLLLRSAVLSMLYLLVMSFVFVGVAIGTLLG